MAPVTSSSDRNKRQKSSKAAVRSDKGRQNRQSASKAKTTNDSNRPRTGASSKITKGEQRKVTNTAKVTRSSTERPQLPPRGGSSAGKLATPAGKLATTGSRSITDTRIQRANVRVLDGQQGRLPAGGQKALPPGRSLTGLRGALVGAGVMAAGEAILGPVARKTGEAVGNALKRQADGKGADYMRQGEKQKANTGGVRRRVNADSMQDKMSRAQRNAQYRQASLERTNRIKASIPDARQAPTTNDGQANRQSSQRRSSGSMMSTPQGRQSSARASQAAPRTATAGTGGQGRKWEDFNPGRGTSETTNPLIKKDSWLMGKIQQREDRMSQNVGPVADGTEYASSKKASEIVARRKKKEEEDKKKTQQ